MRIHLCCYVFLTYLFIAFFLSLYIYIYSIYTLGVYYLKAHLYIVLHLCQECYALTPVVGLVDLFVRRISWHNKE